MSMKVERYREDSTALRMERMTARTKRAGTAARMMKTGDCIMAPG